MAEVTTTEVLAAVVNATAAVQSAQAQMLEALQGLIEHEHDPTAHGLDFSDESHPTVIAIRAAIQSALDGNSGDTDSPDEPDEIGYIEAPVITGLSDGDTDVGQETVEGSSIIRPFVVTAMPCSCVPTGFDVPCSENNFFCSTTDSMGNVILERTITLSEENLSEGNYYIMDGIPTLTVSTDYILTCYWIGENSGPGQSTVINFRTSG